MFGLPRYRGRIFGFFGPFPYRWLRPEVNDDPLVHALKDMNFEMEIRDRGYSERRQDRMRRARIRRHREVQRLRREAWEWTCT